MAQHLARHAALAVLVSILAAAPVLAQPRYFRMPTDAERAAPQPSGATLVQAALGLELSAPPGVTLLPEDPAVQAQLEATGPVGARTINWWWGSPDRGTIMIVAVNLESRRSAERRDAYVSTMLATTAGDLRAQGATVEVTRRGAADHVARGTHPAGATYVIRVFGYEHGDAFVVVSISMMNGSTALESVVMGAHGRE